MKHSGVSQLLTGSWLLDRENAKDFDIVVIYNWKFSVALQEAGFNITPHDEYPNDNLSACYRKGPVNIIACRDQETWDKWSKATDLAYAMRLKDKHARVILFQFVTEGKVRDWNIYYNKPPVAVEDPDPF